MSESGNAGKGRDPERERLRVERERNRQDNRKLRGLKVLGAAILVLGVGVLVWVNLAVKGEGDKESTQSRPVNTGSAGAPVTLTVHEGYRCPDCRRFEERFHETVDALRREGALRVEYHVVAREAGGRAAQYAAEAALCAHDQNRFVPYHETLYENQPPGHDAPAELKAYLVRLATQVEGLPSIQFEECVERGLKQGRVKRSTMAFQESGHSSLPVVTLDDQVVYGHGERITPTQLRRMVEERA